MYNDAHHQQRPARAEALQVQRAIIKCYKNIFDNNIQWCPPPAAPCTRWGPYKYNTYTNLNIILIII